MPCSGARGASSRCALSSNGRRTTQQQSKDSLPRTSVPSSLQAGRDARGLDMEHWPPNRAEARVRTIWTPTLAWLAAVTAALMLALAAPNESNFLGQLPKLSVKRLDQQRIVLPQELPAQRTLALVAFRSSQREEIRSWIQRLRLDKDDSIAWFKMPVLKDPG